MKEVVEEIFCPHCQKKNKVFIMVDESFNQKEEVYCDYCGLKMTEILAGMTPQTEYVNEE